MAAQSHAVQALDTLPATPASAVKKEGWRGMMRALASTGKLVVTNHNHPEAVILSTAEYTRLVEAAAASEQSAADPLAELRRKFDQRLSALNEPDAGDRLRALMQGPARLNGKVKAGSTY